MATRTRRLSLVGLLVLLLFSIFWGGMKFRGRNSSVTAPRRTEKTAEEQLNIQSNLQKRSGGTMAQSPSTSNRLASSPTSPKTQVPGAVSLPMESTAQHMNAPIFFYGQVVDQADRPLSGVRILAGLRQWAVKGVVDIIATFPNVELESDADGRFNILNQRGDVLTIESVNKPGYALSPRAAKSFGYKTSQNHSPDIAHPVVFKMWKIGASEDLKSVEKLFGVAPDSRTYTLDLVEGKKYESATSLGDIRIKFTRPEGISPNDRFSWKVVLEAADGGLMETQDEFMFLAPESGYSDKWEIKFDSGQKDWAPNARKRFFFRSRNGTCFGAFTAEFIADYNGKSAIDINAVVNPNKSRNLQPLQQ